MSIISAILDYKEEYEKGFEQKLNACVSECKNLENTIEDKRREYDKRVNIQKEYPGAIKDIREFADMMNIQQSQISFPVEAYETESVSKEITLANELYKTKTEQVKMYSRYLEIKEYLSGNHYRLKKNGEIEIKSYGDIKILRSEAERYIPEYEWLFDVSDLFDESCHLFNEIINQKYYFEYNDQREYGNWYRAYKEALEVFSTKAIRELGHPGNDPGWSDGTVDLVISFCRASYEHLYLCGLNDQIEYCKKWKDRKTLKEVLKYEKDNFIISAWKEDTSLIENTQHKDSLFYKGYKSFITDGVKKKVDEFIATI